MEEGLFYQHLVVPLTSYPRCNYISKYAKLLLSEYCKLLDSFNVEETSCKPLFKDISVFFVSGSEADILKASQVALKKVESVTYKMIHVEEFKRLSENRDHHDGSIFIAPYQYRKELEKLGPHTLLVEDSLNEDSVQSKEEVIKESVARQDLARNIAEKLERNILSYFDDRMAVLKWLMEFNNSEGYETINNDRTKDDKKSATASVEVNREQYVQNGLRSKRKQSSKIKDRPRKKSKENTKGMKKSTTQTSSVITEIYREGSKLLYSRTTSQDPYDKSTSKSHPGGNCASDTIRKLHEMLPRFPKKIEKAKDVAEQLYGEIKGMLYRSGVQLTDFKNADVDMIKVLDKNSAQEILSIEGVIRVGYRFKTLEIEMDKSLKPEERELRKGELINLLENRNTSKYVIYDVDREIKRFHEVGAEIHNSVCGTLGGFAQFGPKEDLCILLSGHIAKQGDCISLRTSSNPHRLKHFADVLHSQTEHQTEQDSIDIDIAMATVKESERNKCQLQFRDEDGEHLSSIIKTFANEDEEITWLTGLHVHIWGAKSKPGLGKVLIPKMFDKEASIEEPFLRIVNRNSTEGQEIQKFAKEGDSGAILCANDIDGDVIQTVAMLIGDTDFKDINGDRAYVAFKLKAGIEFLQKKHNERINLC